MRHLPYETLILEKEEGVATITLNRPERKNALNLQLLEELGQAVKAIEEDDETRAVVLTGGDKFFCAGADIEMLGQFPSLVKQFRFACEKMTVHSLAKLRKPTIAAVAGYALGGGCELALACDLRIASSTAVFGMPEVGLGMIPGAGGTQRLPRLIGAGRAKEMIFTGEFISAEEAHRIGLVNRVVVPERLIEEAGGLAQKLAHKAPLALQAAKAAIDEGLNVDLEMGLRYEAHGNVLLAGTRDREEGIRAFLEKRSPVFTGE